MYLVLRRIRLCCYLNQGKRTHRRTHRRSQIIISSSEQHNRIHFRILQHQRTTRSHHHVCRRLNICSFCCLIVHYKENSSPDHAGSGHTYSFQIPLNCRYSVWLLFETINLRVFARGTLASVQLFMSVASRKNHTRAA